jgi:hypothetical protein
MSTTPIVAPPTPTEIVNQVLADMNKAKATFAVTIQGRQVGLIWKCDLEAGNNKMINFDADVARQLARELRRVVDRIADGRAGKKVG